MLQYVPTHENMSQVTLHELLTTPPVILIGLTAVLAVLNALLAL